VDIWYN